MVINEEYFFLNEPVNEISSNEMKQNDRSPTFKKKWFLNEDLCVKKNSKTFFINEVLDSDEYFSSYSHKICIKGASSPHVGFSTHTEATPNDHGYFWI